MKMLNKGLGTLVMGLGVVAGHCQAGMRGVKFYSANRFSDVAIGSLDNGLNELSGFLNCCKKTSNPQGFDEAMELIDLGLRAARIARKGFDLGLVENVHKITGNLGVQPCIFDRQDEKAIYDYFGNDEKIIGYIKEIQKVFQKMSKNKSTPNFRERNQSCKASIKTAHSCNVQALKTSYQSRNEEKLNRHVDERTQTMSSVEEKIQTPPLIEDAEVKAEGNWDVKITSPQELEALLASENHATRGSLLIKGLTVEGTVFNELKKLLSKMTPSELLFENCWFDSFSFMCGLESLDKLSVIDCGLSADEGLHLLGCLPSEKMMSIDLSKNNLGDVRSLFLNRLKEIIADGVFDPLIIKDNGFSKEEISDFIVFLKQYGWENVVEF